MLAAIGRWAVAHRRFVLAGAFLLFCAAVIGSFLPNQLATGGFVDPGSRSSQATALMYSAFPEAHPDVVVLVSSGSGVDAPQARAAADRVDGAMRALDMRGVASYWSTGDSRLVARDGSSGLVVGFSATPAAVTKTTFDQLSGELSRTSPDVTITLGGVRAIQYTLDSSIKADLVRMELIALPVIFLVLLLAFRSVLASLLPLSLGLLAIAVTFCVLRVLSWLTEVSSYSLNLTIALAFGLAVDYGLLMVRRYREEARVANSTEDAIAATCSTAGRTIAFSASVVSLSLAALAIFPMYFLRSFAYAGLTVVVVSAVAAIVVVPAMLAAAGSRLDRFGVPRRLRPAVKSPSDEARDGGWARLGRAVLRRPALTAIGTTAVLVLLTMPAFAMNLGVADDRQLPADAGVSLVQQELRNQYSGSASIDVIVEPSADLAANVAQYSNELSRLPDVGRVYAPDGTYAAGQRAGEADSPRRRVSDSGLVWIEVEPTVDPNSLEAKRLVERIRATPAPGRSMEAGLAAERVDTASAVGQRIWWVAAIIGLGTLLLVLLLVRAPALAVKAFVLTALSMSAAFGLVVWIFQQGHLNGVLGGFQAPGYLDITAPVLMAVVGFGLAMDYELFLLTRMVECYRNTKSNELAIVQGLDRTAGLITSAAMVLAVSLLALAASDIVVLKALGVGLAIMIIVDATVVRGILAPALMGLLGAANWVGLRDNAKRASRTQARKPKEVARHE